MPAYYASLSSLRDELAVCLGLEDAASLPAHMLQVSASALDQAYYQLRGILFGRQYTAAQVDAWEGRASYHKRLALCHCLRVAANAGRYDPAAIEGVCGVEKELLTLSLVTNDPDPGDLGQPARVGTGARDVGCVGPHLSGATGAGYGFPSSTQFGSGVGGGCCGDADPNDSLAGIVL